MRRISARALRDCGTAHLISVNDFRRRGELRRSYLQGLLRRGMDYRESGQEFNGFEPEVNQSLSKIFGGLSFHDAMSSMAA